MRILLAEDEVPLANLRKKLNALQASIQIKSTRNAGYSLEKL